MKVVRRSGRSTKTSKPVKGKELSDFLETGHVPIPSKWVDTVKNFHEEHKPDYVPEFKSRLVSCGNFEDAEGVRTDAPASDIETHALVAVHVACHGVPLHSLDIKSAYFQAMPLELALSGMDPKLRYKSGPSNFQELGVLTTTDASFAGVSGSKSQQGRILFSGTCATAT